MSGGVTFATAATQGSPPGVYAVTIASSTLAAPNYDIRLESGILTVAHLELERPGMPDCLLGATSEFAQGEGRRVADGVYCGESVESGATAEDLIRFE